MDEAEVGRDADAGAGKMCAVAEVEVVEVEAAETGGIEAEPLHELAARRDEDAVEALRAADPRS